MNLRDPAHRPQKEGQEISKLFEFVLQNAEGFWSYASMHYPDSENRIDYDYGSPGSADDVLNRVRRLEWNGAAVASYSWLGERTPAIVKYEEPGVELTYFDSGQTGEGGDPYTGLDRFGRIIDQRWRRLSDGMDSERVKYGYDRSSSRVWRQNMVAAAGHDEYYAYDGLKQLRERVRGTLNAEKTGMTGAIAQEEDWNYDPSGNWHGSPTAYLRSEIGSTVLDQNREHNTANEITDITANVGSPWLTPGHDRAGNLVSIPPPLSLSGGYDLKWDAWNRLVEVRQVPGLGGALVAKYRYDGEHRRVTKETGGELRHYYYSDQWQVIEERPEAEEMPRRRYVWGLRSIDDLVCREEIHSGGSSSSSSAGGPGEGDGPEATDRLYALADAMEA